MIEQTQTLIGGKTVSEKYTINSEYDICLDGKVYIANKNLNGLCYISLFCRLLNENKERKAMPRIDIKKLKEVFDIFAFAREETQDFSNFYEKFEQFYFENRVSIESLESEE